jgi:hypothetical protein
MDPQGHLSVGLGLDPIRVQYTTYDLLTVAACNVIFHKKCDYVYETSSTYSHGLIIKNATERIHPATGLILSIFNATGLTMS